MKMKKKIYTEHNRSNEENAFSHNTINRGVAEDAVDRARSSFFAVFKRNSIHNSTT